MSLGTLSIYSRGLPCFKKINPSALQRDADHWWWYFLDPHLHTAKCEWLGCEEERCWSELRGSDGKSFPLPFLDCKWLKCGEQLLQACGEGLVSSRAAGRCFLWLSAMTFILPLEHTL